MNRSLENRLAKIEAKIKPSVVMPWCFAFNQREDEARQAYIERHGHEPLQILTFRVIEPVSKGDL